MKKVQKKPQQRACSVCGKRGHNKSRCSEFLRQISNQPEKTPPVLFVVHTDSPNVQSPHLINLKTDDNPWSRVEAEAPSTNDNWYYYYHAMRDNESPVKLGEVEINEEAEAMPIEKFEESNFENEYEDTIELPEFSPVRQTEEFVEEKPELTEQEKNYFFWRRLTWQTALVALLIFIPFKADSYYHKIKSTTENIASNGTAGFMALQESTSAIMRSDIDGAEASVISALNKFNAALNEMNNKHRVLQKIASALPIVSNEVLSRQNIITAGQKIATGNTFLIQGISKSQETTTSSLSERISLIVSNLGAAIPNYEEALKDLGEIDPGVLPLEYQAPFNDFKLLFTAFLDDMKNLSDLGSSVSEIFGGEGLRRYLLVFQNPHEIRPTGGFLGSFALIDVKDGKIVNIDVPAGGSYDLQGQLNEYVEPPTPLLLSNKRWEFQDANWFPDFPASAEKMMWFYRHSRDITVDGVIAINSSVLERLLSIFGPISDEKRNLTITSENAIAQIQKIVEEGPEKKANKPKQILSDLAPQFINYFFNLKNEQIAPLLISLSEALEQKEIQAYFTDSETEETIKSFGWGGQIIQTKNNQDYLFVVNTNIQGQKSDANIKQTISHQMVVAEDGTVTDSVIITRTHTGTPGEKLYGQPNIDYIRVYVPLNSQLTSAGGFIWPDEKSFRAPDLWTRKDSTLDNLEKEVGIDENTGTRITNEFGKTAFGNWIILEPGETKQIHFTYRLPYKIMPLQEIKTGVMDKLMKDTTQMSQYQLVVQRQSGQEGQFESQLIYPNYWHPSWTDGANMTLAMNGVSIGPMPLETDSVWSLMMTTEK